ncbi:MAG: AurF domain containing protein [Blastocatellia bacterium AA13]|nr:MAG: AurF domain containing protein [Blastocatellia bacterium AA13]
MDTVANTDFTRTLNRLVELSIDGYYNPYTELQWEEALDDEQWWMPASLLTLYDTKFIDEFDEPQLMKLSKWESIHFYSLNIHGIRELLIEVTKRIHSPGYEGASEFFHHFIGEENEHMWFFAKFCLKYGSKIYPDKSMKMNVAELESDIQTFLVFARILIFEEIVDYFNIRIGKDESLHPVIRQVNNVHHQDESRHVAFGRQFVAQLHRDLIAAYGHARLTEIEGYLRRYIDASLQSFYNPAVYRDAGIEDEYRLRSALLKEPGRTRQHEKIMGRTTDFLIKNGILSEENSTL